MRTDRPRHANLYDASGARVHPLQAPGWIKSFSHDSVRRQGAPRSVPQQKQRSLSDAVLERAGRSPRPDPHHVFNVPELVTHYENITRVRTSASRDVGVVTGSGFHDDADERRYETCDSVAADDDDDGEGAPRVPDDAEMREATASLDQALADIEHGDYINYDNCDKDIGDDDAVSNGGGSPLREAAREPTYVNDLFHISAGEESRDRAAEADGQSDRRSHTVSELDKALGTIDSTLPAIKVEEHEGDADKHNSTEGHLGKPVRNAPDRYAGYGLHTAPFSYGVPSSSWNSDTDQEKAIIF
ncbi:PREDICTED: uncharacterized protein LOC106812771 [Priapulus caudatus]|uniref:Uncharacterized protein LOC106812771 n=1 Tax=Priapulus caudatus TaxID=37621 RepID=A0ABM1EJ57_PRICU|nr:PREDICTED: uncharacterized protein LOC106812771 [Priapulus caudatus]